MKFPTYLAIDEICIRHRPAAPGPAIDEAAPKIAVGEREAALKLTGFTSDEPPPGRTENGRETFITGA